MRIITINFGWQNTKKKTKKYIKATKPLTTMTLVVVAIAMLMEIYNALLCICNHLRLV